MPNTIYNLTVSLARLSLQAQQDLGVVINSWHDRGWISSTDERDVILTSDALEDIVFQFLNEASSAQPDPEELDLLRTTIGIVDSTIPNRIDKLRFESYANFGSERFKFLLKYQAPQAVGTGPWTPFTESEFSRLSMILFVLAKLFTEDMSQLETQTKRLGSLHKWLNRVPEIKSNVEISDELARKDIQEIQKIMPYFEEHIRPDGSASYSQKLDLKLEDNTTETITQNEVYGDKKVFRTKDGRYIPLPDSAPSLPSSIMKNQDLTEQEIIEKIVRPETLIPPGVNPELYDFSRYDERRRLRTCKTIAICRHYKQRC
ncbi:MAG: hypothetical protein IPK04_15870 [Bdellovibrionales bacterium]|nr:hypothetical protein [Bdellovibrionales bacterium]